MLGIDADAKGIGNRVGDPEEGNLEVAGDVDDGVAVVLDDVDLFLDPRVLDLVADQGGRQARGIDDRDIDGP